MVLTATQEITDKRGRLWYCDLGNGMRNSINISSRDELELEFLCNESESDLNTSETVAVQLPIRTIDEILDSLRDSLGFRI
jgi:hypothetical protein